jgi:hypothetical protein
LFDGELGALFPEALPPPLEPPRVPDVVVPLPPPAPVVFAAPVVFEPEDPFTVPDAAPLEVPLPPTPLAPEPVAALPVEDAPLEAPVPEDVPDEEPLPAAESTEASLAEPASSIVTTPASTGVVAIPVAPKNCTSAAVVWVSVTPVRMAGAGLGVICTPAIVWFVGSTSTLVVLHLPVFEMT